MAALLQRHGNLRKSALPSGDRASILDLSATAFVELKAIVSRDPDGDSLLYLPAPALSGAFPSGRLLVTDAMNRDAAWIARSTRRGRVSSLTLALPVAFAEDGRAFALRGSFVDYSEGEWKCRRFDRWDLWEASTLAR